MSSVSAKQFYVNQARGYNWAVKSIAWGKRKAPESIQLAASKVADVVGGVIQKVWPDYLIQQYRLDAASYNYHIHDIGKEKIEDQEVEVDSDGPCYIELNLGSNPTDKILSKRIDEWAYGITFDSITSEKLVSEVFDWIEKNASEEWITTKGASGKEQDLTLSAAITREMWKRVSLIKQTEEYQSVVAERERAIEEKLKETSFEVKSLEDYWRYWSMRVDHVLAGARDIEMAAKMRAFVKWQESAEGREMSARWDKLSHSAKCRINRRVYDSIFYGEK
ncbi:hypothetical protein ACFL52_01635 [Candidatus Margulisiibacteriota bacterium]